MRRPLPPERSPDPMASVVDRLLAQLPGLQADRADARGTPSRPVELRAGAGPTTIGSGTLSSGSGRSHGVRAWARLLMVLALGFMMSAWPYGQTCGVPLFGYLLTLLVLVLAAGGAAAAAWRARIALAHVVALVFMLYGGILIMAELLPRTGYAARQATWQCGTSAASPQWVAYFQ